jgi:putative nucleotidyltransferase with HDIG domain
MTSAPDTASLRPDANRERVELILAQIEQLPTLPAVATRLLELTTSPNSNAADVVSVIKTDQALTSKILSLVRRADLGVRGDVMTIERVVALMGFEAVRNAVLSIQIYETFASVEPHDEAEFDRSEFWKHSLAVACAAQLIAEATGPRTLSGEAFVCGLLHDIGKIALDACLPKSYARVIRQTRQRRQCICDAEREVLGLDHSVAGRRLLTRWKLPRPIVETAWLHHQPPAALPASIQAAPLVRIVHWADNLVRRQRIGFSGYQRVEPTDGLVGALGLSREAVAQIAAKLGERVEQHRRLVGLDRLTSSSLYAEALADANEELGRLNASLADSNRRLELRSRYFDALRAFSDGLALDDRVVDVCRSAARCLADLLGVPRAVAFAVGHNGLVQAAAAATDGTPSDDGFQEPLVGLSPAELQASVTTNRLAAPPPCTRPLCERLHEFLGDDPVWMLSFTHANTCVGGVLFSAGQEQVDRHNAAEAELEALRHAFGLAAASAVARADAQRLNEELAEVNRRLHDAQAELLRTRSLTMIAAMAAGAAHELNNPLAVISGRAQLLARQCPDDTERRALEIIQEHCTRATEIVSELMEFAKPDPPRPANVPLAPWAEELRRRWLERSSLRPDRFTVEISDPGVAVRVDPGQLDQVFEAIIANALDATAGRDPRVVINSASTTSDDTVVVAVEDTGAGMEPDVLEHALDPFFSHRPAGRGRGLGLSRAARLVETNGGRLWLDSAPGQGTTVFVELPSSRKA